MQLAVTCCKLLQQVGVVYAHVFQKTLLPASCACPRPCTDHCILSNVAHIICIQSNEREGAAAQKAHPTGPVTAADATTQLGKRKRAETQLQQVPPTKPQAATATTLPPAHPADAVSLQPQPGPRSLPPSAAIPPQQESGDVGHTGTEKHHQNAANNVPSGPQPTSDLATDPVTSSAQEALPPASHPGSLLVPDTDTGQSQDAYLAVTTGPQQGSPAPAMPGKGNSGKDMPHVERAGPESTPHAHQSEQPSLKHSLPSQEAATKEGPRKLPQTQRFPTARNYFSEQGCISAEAHQLKVYWAQS